MRSAAVVVAVIGVTAGTVPAIAAQAPADSDEVVLPAGTRYLPRREQVVEAGVTGYVHYQESQRSVLWTDYRTGETKQLPRYELPAYNQQPGLRATATTAADGAHQVVITDVAGGTTTTVPLPQGYGWTRAYTSDSVLAVRVTDRVVTGLSIIRLVDGKAVEQPVEGLPQGFTQVFARQQDNYGVVLGFRGADGKNVLHLLQYGTGALRALPAEFQPGDIRLGKDHLLTYPDGNGRLYTLRRDDPSATGVALTMPAPTSHEREFAEFAVVGDWIVYRRGLDVNEASYVQGNKLWAMPVTGGTPRELLPYAAEGVLRAPDGSAVVTGGTGPKDWAVRRVTVGQDGAPQLGVVTEVAPVTAQINGIALGAGTLSYFSNADANPLTALYERRVALTGAPEATAPVVRALTLGSGTAPQALGDGRTAYANGRMLYSPTDTGSGKAVMLPDTARLDDAFGTYVLGKADIPRYVGDFEKGQGDNAPSTTSAAPHCGAARCGAPRTGPPRSRRTT